jgi:hypothetical protein
LVATVVEEKHYELEVEKGKVVINHTIIDNTLYFHQTNSEDEADYLTAVFNSSVLNKLVKPLQTRGFSERDFHKKPLEFPIPRFNPSDPIHKKLSDLGKNARSKVCKDLENILKKLGYYNKVVNFKPLTENQVGKLRKEVRNSISDLLAMIDELTEKLLLTSVQGGKGT